MTGKKSTQKEHGKNRILHWLGIGYLGLQAILGLVVGISLFFLNMLPMKYFIVLCVIMLLLFGWNTWLLMGKGKKKHKKGRKVGGAFLNILLILVYLYLANMILSTNVAMEEIASEVQMEDVVAVYVKEEDSAKNLEDAKDYVFGYTTTYDAENTTITIHAMEKELNQELQLTSYDTVHDMVEAFYQGEVGAIILNEAYVGILEEQEEYATFSSDTRIIYEYSVFSELKAVEDVDLTEEPFIVYISGSDTRSEKLATSRSDVNLLAVVNPKNRQILLVNTPRDYYIPLSVSNGVKDKLTHAGLYGVDVSSDTLAMLYDVEISYYAQVNFAGFEELVDAIGGITIESEISFTTLNGGYYIKEGENELSGAEALGYVRERKAFGEGDIQRGRNQMKVIAAIIDKATSPVILTKYTSIMDSMAGTFNTNLTSEQISELVKMQLSEGGGWQVLSYTVNGTGDSSTTYSMPNQKSYVMIPDQTTVDCASDFIKRVLAGETLTEEDLQ
ncbi:MAG: LCP family protein [Roseburia sp.]